MFATDPVIAASGDGSLYLVGKDNYNSIWSGRFVPGTGFQNWQPLGGVVQGKPALTTGADGAAYIAIRDNGGSVWMVRVSGNTLTGWFNGGGMVTSDPQISDGGGVVYVAALSSGETWYKPFPEGVNNSWQPWADAGGTLQDFSLTIVNGGIYIAGRDLNDDLWWYGPGVAVWNWLGYHNLAAGPMVVGR